MTQQFRFVMIAFFGFFSTLNAQEIDSVQVKKHLYTLASDEMQGGRTGTAGIEKVAKYIEGEFKRMGLKNYADLSSYQWTFTFTSRRSNKNTTEHNIIGVLEGKSKKDEMVIISAHYDHIGMKKDGEGNLIFNGANDDATGVLALAEYFAKEGNNERTILLITFTAEEMWLIGSKYLGKGIDATKVIARINLEMIGKESASGSKTAWLTGFDRSDFGKMIQKSLEGSGYKLFPDPYARFGLFYRSDNASLARLGVPAHTFSITQIDKDYHQIIDEAETLDIGVITETIKAVTKGKESIIEEVDTPSRFTLKE